MVRDERYAVAGGRSLVVLRFQRGRWAIALQSDGTWLEIAPGIFGSTA